MTITLLIMEYKKMYFYYATIKEIVDIVFGEQYLSVITRNICGDCSLLMFSRRHWEVRNIRQCKHSYTSQHTLIPF